MDKIVYGADTETLDGEPLSLQFYSEDVACDEIYFVNARTAADRFAKWCKGRRRGVLHVVYIHNLEFDLPELLWGHHEKLVQNHGEFDFRWHDFRVAGVYGAPTFCRISNGHDISIMLVDSFSYFRGSLDRASALFCPDLPKLERPVGLGERKFTARDTGFCEYAMRDAVVAYHIGKGLERVHQEYDIEQTVSVADMAARIFRHKYLRELDYIIVQPGREVIEAALLSYHGGKNNMTVPPGWYADVSSLDISSAYPDAMRNMPSFAREDLYKRYSGRKAKQVPDYGVYCVSGVLEKCAWPVIFSHAFKPLSGEITDVWVQGFELNEALRSGELNLKKIRGHYYDAEKDIQVPALRYFVEEFYAKKEAELDEVMRQMQKFILNSISGKFIQTRKRNTCAYTDVDSGSTVSASELVAGGMFHPFIASAITAHTRARIHGLEHEYEAIHTATDGIMTQQPAKAMGKGLGSLTLEAKDSTAVLLRNKCYVQYADRSQVRKDGKHFRYSVTGKKIAPSHVFKSKFIVKEARHGFQGGIATLESLIASGKREYFVSKPNRLKQSVQRGLKPNLFERKRYVLKVGELK